MGKHFLYKRRYFSESGNCCGGILYLDGSVLGFVLEPDNLTDITPGKRFKIPNGSYNLSPHVRANGQRWALMSSDLVPASRCICIHGGNSSSHSAGCLLVGKEGLVEDMGGYEKLVKIWNCKELVELCYNAAVDGATLEISNE